MNSLTPTPAIRVRPTLDEFMMSLAATASQRSTCIRRSVGCVLTNKLGQVLSIGYNGVPRGAAHCFDGSAVCKNHDQPPGLDSCGAVHAEQNAILQCRDAFSIDTAYITLSPCKACIKLLMNTSCTRIVFAAEHSDLEPKELWLASLEGRSWVHLTKALDAA